MNIPLDLVRTLDVVVTSGSLDAAAAQLHITASAVSQRIKALETRLGRVVLVRSRPVRATPAGQAMIRMARQLDTLEADTLSSLGLAPDGPLEVPLAVNADSLATWFLPALASLAGEGVVFDLHRDDQDYTAGLLESGTVSAAVTSQHDPVPGCAVRPLGSMRYLPVAEPGFAARWFAGPDRAGYRRAPLIDFDRRDAIQTQYLTAIGVDPSLPPRHRVPASSDFAHAVQLGFGWALVPEFQSRAAIEAGSLVRLDGPGVDVPLFWQRWKLDSPLLATIESAVLAAARAALRR